MDGIIYIMYIYIYIYIKYERRSTTPMCVNLLSMKFLEISAWTSRASTSDAQRLQRSDPTGTRPGPDRWCGTPQVDVTFGGVNQALVDVAAPGFFRTIGCSVR